MCVKLDIYQESLHDARSTKCKIVETRYIYCKVQKWLCARLRLEK